MSKKVKFGILMLFVLILIGAQPSLYWLILKNKQSKIQKQTQNLIALKKIKKTYILIINKDKNLTSLKWKNNHEFYKDGFICDVVSMSNDGKNLIIKYIHDKKETKIESNIKKLFNNDKNETQHPPKKKNTFILTYIQSKILKQKTLFHKLIRQTSYCKSLYQSFNLSPPSPPPQS